MNDNVRYPIGKYVKPEKVGEAERALFIKEIAEAPAALRGAVRGLTQQQLDTPYREGGWTVRQVVHHVADSHINAFVRIKLTLTEEVPVVRPYNEKLWAETAEARSGPVEVSLDLLDALHRRWSALLKALPPETFDRKYNHPDSGPATMNNLIALYAWHGRHHTAQITSLRERMGWK